MLYTLCFSPSCKSATAVILDTRTIRSLNARVDNGIWNCICICMYVFMCIYVYRCVYREFESAGRCVEIHKRIIPLRICCSMYSQLYE